MRKGSNSRTYHAILGIVTDFGGTTLLTIVGFVITPVILSLTSAAQYGFWVTILSILGYLALTDFGLGVSLSQLVAGVADKQDGALLSRPVSSAFVLFCAAGFLFGAVGYSISPFLPGWFGLPPEDASVVLAAYRIAVISGALSLPLSIFTAIVVGFQRIGFNNTVQNFVSLVAVAVSLVLLSLGFGIVALALSSLFTVVVSSTINYFYTRRLAPELTISLRLVNRTDLKRLLTFGGYFQLARIANTVQLSTDNIVIGAAKGAAMVTQYSITAKLPVLLSVNIASKLPISLFPALSQLYSQDDGNKLRQVFILLVHYATRLAVVGCVLIAILNYQFVSIWVGSQYYGGAWLNAIFVFWVLQDSIYRGTAVVAQASGDLRGWSISSVVEAVLNLALSILLVMPLGIVGVALATAISKGVTTSWYVPYWICRKLHIPMRRFVLRGILIPAFRCLPGICLTIWFSTLISKNLGWHWIIMVAMVAAVTNILFFEAVELSKPSDLAWTTRIRQLLQVREMKV